MTDLESPSESLPILRRTREPKSSLFLWFLQVIIVLGLCSVTLWLVLTPKSPIYVITDAYIPSLDGRNSTSLHTGNSSVLLYFEFSNLNTKMGIDYNDINITLYYRDAIVGSKSLPGFYQGYKRTAVYEVEVNAHEQSWQGITNTTTGMRVCLENAVKYKILSFMTKHHQIYNEAYVIIGSDGRISGQKTIKLHHPKPTKN